jgi:hypothetical protein
VFAGLLGAGAAADIATGRDQQKRKRRRRKRCLKLGTVCSTVSGKRCCKGMRCDFTAGLTMQTLCCRKVGERCRRLEHCCADSTCDLDRQRCEPI